MSLHLSWKEKCFLMSVQVSYKNQFVVYISLLLIFLIVVEIIANFWLYNIYRCDFESNEIFKDVDPETNRKLCLESLEYDFTAETIPLTLEEAIDKDRILQVNSHNIRAPEITEKPENTIRIFMIGGSTTWGSGVLDNETYPYFLQTMFDKSELNFNVEIINAGIPSAMSWQEIKWIKNTWIDFEPDLFIVLDPWNDMRNQLEQNNFVASPTQWSERWIKSCELGKQSDFDTIITIQPFGKSGSKILTEQELIGWTEKENKVPGPLKYRELSEQYVEQLDQLKNHCTVTADLRGIFDDVQEPIFWDYIHTGLRGNEIIAEKMYELSLPVVMKRAQNLVNDEDSISSVKYGASSDTLEINENLDSENFDYYLEQSYSTLQTILFPYKTPKVLELIINQ